MANLEEKIGEAIVEVGKETVSDLVRPTSKSIGDNIGLLVDGVMGWLGYWGKKQKIKRNPPKSYICNANTPLSRDFFLFFS